MQNAPKRRSLAKVGTIASGALVGALVITATPAAQATEQASNPTPPVFSSIFQQVTTTEALEVSPLAAGMVVPLESFGVSAGFGHSTGVHAGRSHAGIDMTGPDNAKIRSATDGKVVQAGPSGGYGNLVTVKTEDGHKLLYAHMSKIVVKKGDQVTAGETLGRQGSTGHSTGPHLHFEVHNKKGKPINPVEFLGLERQQLIKMGKASD